MKKDWFFSCTCSQLLGSANQTVPDETRLWGIGPSTHMEGKTQQESCLTQNFWSTNFSTVVQADVPTHRQVGTWIHVVTEVKSDSQLCSGLKTVFVVWYSSYEIMTIILMMNLLLVFSTLVLTVLLFPEKRTITILCINLLWDIRPQLIILLSLGFVFFRKRFKDCLVLLFVFWPDSSKTKSRSYSN